MSLLDIKKLEDIEQLTLTEYNYRMYAYEYEHLQKIQDQYNLAFAIRNVKATKNIGTEKKPKEEYVFKSTEDIIDYKENIERLNQGLPIKFKHDGNITPPSHDLKLTLQRIAEANKANK